MSVAEKREQTLTTYFATERNASGSTLVYGYYGHFGNGPAGHAVAYSKGEFFDSNSGLWTCNPPDSAGPDIDTYVTKYYTRWTPEKFVIFILVQK